MSDLSMLINGLAVSAEKGATFERRNPLDGSIATRAPAASAADAVAAVEAAADAFTTWSRHRPRRTPRAAAEGRRRAGGQDAEVHRGRARRDRRHRRCGPAST
jgi:acyl-CoA reductase-like NAD-dependent aldehyde dehydrogenase